MCKNAYIENHKNRVKWPKIWGRTVCSKQKFWTTSVIMSKIKIKKN